MSRPARLTKRKEKPMKKMMLALWLVAMVVAAGCDNVISARELVKRTSGDKVNTIMWYYIGSENGCDCFCHEMMCLSASLPCPSVSHKTYYAVRSSEFPMFTRRFSARRAMHGTRRRTSSATPSAQSALRGSSSGAIEEILFIGRTSFQMALQF